MISLKNITLGQYMDTQSVVHRLDPRTKLIAFLLMMTGAFVSTNIYFFLLLTLGCFLVIRLAKLPCRFVLKNLLPFLWLLGMTFGIHLFFTPGTVIEPFSRYGITVTHEGLENGVYFSCRIAVLIIGAALFTLTTSPAELTESLERMLKPLRRFMFPTHELAMIMTIALRFIPTLVEEADRLKKAQYIRGARFTGGPVKRAKALIPFLVPLFLSAFRRADELSIAMDARCYRGGEGRTHFRELKFAKGDAIAFTTTGIVCLGSFLIR